MGRGGSACAVVRLKSGRETERGQWRIPWVAAGVEYWAVLFLVQCPPPFDRPCVNLIFDDHGLFHQRRKNVLSHNLIWGKLARG